MRLCRREHNERSGLFIEKIHFQAYITLHCAARKAIRRVITWAKRGSNDLRSVTRASALHLVSREQLRSENVRVLD